MSAEALFVLVDYVALSKGEPCTQVFKSGYEAQHQRKRLIRRYEGEYDYDDVPVLAAVSTCTVVHRE